MRQNVLQKELIKNKRKSIQDLDNTIYLNQRKIRELDLNLSKLGEKIASYQYDNLNIEKKCLALEERIVTLSKRYDNLVVESNKLS